MNRFNKDYGTLTDGGGRNSDALEVNKDPRNTSDGNYAEYIERHLL